MPRQPGINEPEPVPFLQACAIRLDDLLLRGRATALGRKKPSPLESVPTQNRSLLCSRERSPHPFYETPDGTGPPLAQNSEALFRTRQLSNRRRQYCQAYMHSRDGLPFLLSEGGQHTRCTQVPSACNRAELK